MLFVGLYYTIVLQCTVQKKYMIPFTFQRGSAVQTRVVSVAA